jgi:hypothetical protein
MHIPVVLNDRETYLARSANRTLEVFNFLVARGSRSSIDTVVEAGDHHVAHHQAARLELVDHALQVRLFPGHLRTTHQNVVDPNLLDLPHRLIGDLTDTKWRADLRRVRRLLRHPRAVWAFVFGSVRSGSRYYRGSR